MSQGETEPQGAMPPAGETVERHESRSSAEDSRLDEIEGKLIERAADAAYQESIRNEAEARLRSLDSWRTVFAFGAYIALACAGVLGGLALAGYIEFASLSLEAGSLRFAVPSGGFLIVFVFARFFAAALERAADDVREATAHLTPIGRNLAGLLGKGVDGPKDAAPIAG